MIFNKLLLLNQETFEKELLAWTSNPSHTNSSMLINKATMNFFNKKALTYYTDSRRYIAIFHRSVIIGSFINYNNQTMVIVDEVIQTYTKHCIMYMRYGKPSPVKGIYIFKLKVEE